MIKQQMTPIRAARIHKSVQFMLIMAELIKMEHMSDMDTRFKNPQVNQFAARIQKDCDQIRYHLEHNDNVKIKVSDENFVEEFSGEMYRVFHFFIGLPLSQVKEVMDNLHGLAIENDHD